MNCTAELYCAGKCVGDTLWNCVDYGNALGFLIVMLSVLVLIWMGATVIQDYEKG